jgi:hypothetical protein
MARNILGLRVRFGCEERSEFNEIMKTKIQGARSLLDTLMKKYKQDIAKVR